MIDPSAIEPPDDTGAETFERYYYQAHVAVRYCVDCATDGDVQDIYAEHIEDLALRTSSGWRFIQIKTRDGSRGPWSIGDVTGRRGALHSLLRTHRTVGTALNCTLEAQLEGSLRQGDCLALLAERRDNTDYEKCIADICSRLELEESECRSFAQRLRIRALPPSREVIEAETRGYLSSIAPQCTSQQVKDVHVQLVEAIARAMRAARTTGDYPGCLLEDYGSAARHQARTEAKHLSKSTLQAILLPLGIRPSTLLRRFVDGDRPEPSALERKLTLVGAPDPLIGDAKRLRANAAYRELEWLARGESEPHLEDLQVRLLTYANAVAARVPDSSSAFAAIWAEVLNVLTQNPTVVDPHRVFNQDPVLLLGALCQISDRCQFSWRGFGAQ